MGDWNRVYNACKDATGKEVDDNWDVHLVIEELDAKVRQREEELNTLRIANVVQQSELLIGLLTMLEKEGGNNFINKAEIVAKYQANL